MVFGEGSRACIGRNMARAEFVACLSSLLREYCVELGEGVSAEGLERLLHCQAGDAPFTLTIPEPVSLRLVPRAMSK